MRAERDVKAGEEIFSCYEEDVGDGKLLVEWGFLGREMSTLFPSAWLCATYAGDRCAILSSSPASCSQAARDPQVGQTHESEASDVWFDAEWLKRSTKGMRAIR
jgi:hypothetical protein